MATARRLFTVQYKCTACDFAADRPSAFLAHYRHEHNVEVAAACWCGDRHEPDAEHLTEAQKDWRALVRDARS